MNNDRCIHCGWTKKDHGKKLRCKTRLRETYWHGWRDGDCGCAVCKENAEIVRKPE